MTPQRLNDVPRIDELDGGVCWAARYDDAGNVAETVTPDAKGELHLGAGLWWVRVRTLYDQRTVIPVHVHQPNHGGAE